MATKKGWLIIEKESIPVTIAADVAEGQVGKITAENTASVAGAGDVPRGVFSRDMDVSEGETNTELVTSKIAVVQCAAAITDITLPVMVAAAGTCTPVTANNDIILGMPLNLQATVGGDVAVDLSTMGTFYGA